MDDLTMVVSDAYGLRIEISDVIFEGEYVRGTLMRFEDGRVLVYVRASQTDFEKRAVVAKEISHLVIDEQEDWCTDGTSIIRQLVDEKETWQGNEVVPNAEIQSEKLAEFAALEILYPYTFREKDLEDLRAKKTTLSKLSLEYHIPEVLISRALTEQHMRFVREMWQKVL
jgi:Zn-dependent peptidase ImmA (M78 family)